MQVVHLGRVFLRFINFGFQRCSAWKSFNVLLSEAVTKVWNHAVMKSSPLSSMVQSVVMQSSDSTIWVADFQIRAVLHWSMTFRAPQKHVALPLQVCSVQVAWTLKCVATNCLAKSNSSRQLITASETPKLGNTVSFRGDVSTFIVAEESSDGDCARFRFIGPNLVSKIPSVQIWQLNA